jgi:putative serine protease PepD
MSEPTPTPTPKPGPGNLIHGRAAAIGGIVLLVVAVIGVTAGALIANAGDNSSSSSSVPKSAVTAAACSSIAVTDAVQPTVVTIFVRNGSSGGSGSGETIRDDGYILTNDHVIASAAGGGTVSVLFSDGETEPAKIVGQSEQLDLAVLKVDAKEKLPTIPFGTSENLRVGQAVVALGAPLGLDGTVTAGIVSALGRDVPVPNSSGGTAILPGAIQTDASINPGNSGGALVDCNGRLVGINTSIATVPNSAGQAGGGSVGIGFAIPIDLASHVADQLIDTGKFTLPYLGVSTAPAVVDGFDAPAGLFVQGVSPGSPADTAGLKSGDVITAVDGETTTGPDSIFLAIVSKNAGDQITIDYIRDGEKATANVTLGSQPPSQ